MDRATEAPSQFRRYGAIALLAAVMAGAQVLGAWRDNHAVFINSSGSLANWAFFVTRGKTLHRGDYAFFRAPQTALVTGHFGRNAPPFGKIVYGVAGDQVTRSDNIVRVNGVPIVKLKRFTKLGEALAPGPTGTIPRGCYFMATPHKDGLDSRYADIGFICSDRIIGSGKAIL